MIIGNCVKPELLDIVSTALAKQRKRCIARQAGRLGGDEFVSCTYDDGAGNHCVIGHLLEPDVAATSFGPVGHLPYGVRLSLYLKYAAEGVEFDFFMQALWVLQQWHDAARASGQTSYGDLLVLHCGDSDDQLASIIRKRLQFMAV